MCEISSGQGSMSLGHNKNVAKCQPDFHKYMHTCFTQYSTKEKILQAIFNKNNKIIMI